MTTRLVVWLCCALGMLSAAIGEETVRIATYNIQFLKANIPAQRAAKLKAVISALDADIIGLQEIDDRAALERIFDPSEWSLVIDDQSDDSQDVAAAIRKPFRVISPASLDAEDADFLFPDSQHNSHWPNRRDGLLVEIETPQTQSRISLVVIHAKARSGGRATTESRRVGAAQDLVAYLEGKIDDRLYAVVGDKNDNPDDRSANILETGDPNALPGPEQIDGPFMFNLTERLLADDHVSWGLSSTNIANGVLETRVPGSRDLNNGLRDTNSQTLPPILFDQIVVSPLLHARYSAGSVSVFDDPVAFQGARASDHVPVYADFVFEAVAPAPPSGSALQIRALLPDPAGQDAGNEWVKIASTGSETRDLTGWRLRDRAGNVKSLDGAIEPNSERKIELAAGELPLNNTGDDVELLDVAGDVVHRFSYTAAQVQRGQEITSGVPSEAILAPAILALDAGLPADWDLAPPPSGTLALVSWNIQTGGTSTSATALRPPMVQRSLERMLAGSYQIIAAQEISSEGSSQVLAGLLPDGAGPWTAAFTDTTSRMDNGFWFRPAATLRNHEVLFATQDRDAQGRLIIDESKALHPPHLAHFAVNDFDFTIITTHLTFQGGDAAESRREMDVLLEFLDAYFDTPGHDPDVIICGDFNLPSRASGETAGGLTLDDIIEEDGRFADSARGLRVLVDEKTSRSSAARGGEPARNYDHFILSSDCFEEFISAQRLPTRVLTDDPDDPEERLTSDHFPIVAFFRTSGENVRRDVE